VQGRITRAAAAYVAYLYTAHGAPLRGENVAFCQFNPPMDFPGVPTLPPPVAEDFDECWHLLSGRAAFRLFLLSPPDIEGLPPVFMLGCVPVSNPADLVTLPPPGPADGYWQEFVSKSDGAGQHFLPLPNAARNYVIRSWLPTRMEQYVNYTAPPGRLGDFDVTGALTLRNIQAQAPNVFRYLGVVDFEHYTPLEYLEPGVMDALTLSHRHVACVRGVAYCWDAANLARTQNDAFGRWMNDQRRVLAVPDIRDWPWHMTRLPGWYWDH
jgi:hypothetical protein